MSSTGRSTPRRTSFGPFRSRGGPTGRAAKVSPLQTRCEPGCAAPHPLGGRTLAGLVAVAVMLGIGGCPPASDPGGGNPGPDPGPNPGGGGPPAEPVIQRRSLTDVKVSPTIPGGSRHFLLGAVSVGAADAGFTAQQLGEAVARVAESSECIVVRPLIDWDYFRPNRPAGAQPVRLAETHVIVQMARDHGMRYSLIQLDPLANRHELSPLPPALTGQDFGDEAPRAAIRNMTLELLNLFHPTYLSIGVEVNGYLESNPADFENLVSLHKELYDEIKAIAPETKVALSLHYETLLRMQPGQAQSSGDDARRALIDRFRPQVDVLALSSLPWPQFSDPVYIPLDYIRRVEDFTDLPVILSEIAWTTDPDSDSDELEQRDYLALMARAALRAPQVELVAWAFLTDPPAGTVLDEIPSFTRIGLYDSSGRPKPALALWQELFSRPYRR